MGTQMGKLDKVDVQYTEVLHMVWMIDGNRHDIRMSFEEAENVIHKLLQHMPDDSLDRIDDALGTLRLRRLFG